MKRRSKLLWLTSFLVVSIASAAERTQDLVVGVITAVNGDTIEVFEKRGKKTHTLKLPAATSIKFIGALKETKEIKPDYCVRAHASNGVIGNLYVTLPIEQVAITPTPEMVKMPPAELFKVADPNGDGKVSYVEFSNKIKASLKHGPVTFSKSDKDKSGSLNVKEFGTAMKMVKWWKMSRKTPEEWFKLSDKDENGVLNEKEFTILLGSNAHMNVFFPRADSNKSSDLDQKEVAAYIQTLIFPELKAKNKKKNR
jgi:Ca2+-binding EF-hand superfamily protein